MKSVGHDSLHTRKTLEVEGKTYHYFSIPEAARTIGDVISAACRSASRCCWKTCCVSRMAAPTA